MRRSSLRVKTVRLYLRPGVSSRMDAAIAGLGRRLDVFWGCESDRERSCSVLFFAATGKDRRHAGHEMLVVPADGGQQGDLSG